VVIPIAVASCFIAGNAPVGSPESTFQTASRAVILGSSWLCPTDTQTYTRKNAKFIPCNVA